MENRRMNITNGYLKIFGIIIITCCFALGGINELKAQDAPDLLKPMRKENMPAWANLLYEEPVNLIRLDSAFKAYYRTRSVSKDEYTRYYKRLIMLNRFNMDETGDIIQHDPFRYERKSTADLSGTSRGQLNQWKVEEMETFWLEKPQTPCPWQVNVYALDLCKSNPSFLIAASETGGLYQSVDKGLNWKQVGKEYNLQTKALAIHPKNQDTIFLGISGAIRRSVDGGHHWTTVYSLSDLWVHDLEILENNPNIILAATTKGLLRSNNSGKDWVQIFSQASCDLKSNPANPNIVYALRFNNTGGYYEPVKSVNAGASFSLKNSGWHSLKDGGGRIAVTPADPKRIYAIILTQDKGPHLMRSDNEGESWTIAAKGRYDGYQSQDFPMDNWQGFYDLAIVASPLNADHLITGTGSIFKSTNGGRKFTIHGGYGGDFAVHPDFQCTVANAHETWIGTDGGLTFSTDFFTDVKNASARNKGLNGSDFWGFDSGWREKTYAGGRYHNGNTLYANFSQPNWLRMGGAEQATGYIHPIDTRKVFFSDIGSYSVEKQNDSVMRWAAIPCTKYPNESYYPMEFSKMVWSPICYSRVYLGEKNTLWKSENNGAAFSPLFTLPASDSWVEDIEIARIDHDILYFTERNNREYEGRIWRSNDGGKSFSQLPHPPGTTAGQRRVKAIAINEQNPSVIFQALRSGNSENKVFKSEDFGQTWTNLTTQKISGMVISDIVFQQGTDDGVYLACDGGLVFYRNKSMNDWELHADGLSVSHFTRALKVFYKENKLVNGSSLGVWTSDLFEPSRPIAQASVDKLSSRCDRDTFYFEDYSVLHYDGTQTWSWDFPGASWVSDIHSPSPKVIYSGSGNYDVRLNVSNRQGSSSFSYKNMIEIRENGCKPDSISGNAMDLSGRGNSMSIPSIPSFKGADGFSCTAWIKLNKKQDCFTQIISNWSSNVGMGFGFAFQGYVPTTNLTFFWENVPYQLTSPFNLDTLVWTHVAMVVYPDSVRLYKDGIPWTRRGDFRGFDFSQTGWDVGKGVPGQCGDFDGQIEELKLFNRSLSEDEIRAGMHLIQSDLPGMVAYFQFNESDPDILYDRIGISHGLNSSGLTIKSTAPVSKGISQKISGLKAGWNKMDLSGTDFYLKASPPALTQVYGYRLEEKPHPLPDAGFAPFSSNYFILRQWGQSQNIITDSMNFRNAVDFDSIAGSDPIQFSLLKRTFANDDLPQWEFENFAHMTQSIENSVLFHHPKVLQGQYILAVPDVLLNNQFEENIQPNQPIAVPNPTPGLFRLLSGTGTQKYILTDIYGNPIRSIHSNEKSVIDIQDLPSGVYIIRNEFGIIKLIKY